LSSFNAKRLVGLSILSVDSIRELPRLESIRNL
jgi:hypothetical protein